jgi:Phage derived protein Gp49-like (DUF891)
MGKEQNPEMPVRFYRTEAGGSPVLDWLRGLNKDDRRAIGLDLMRVQFGWPIGRPLVGSLKDGLWEVRSTLPSQRRGSSCAVTIRYSSCCTGFSRKRRKRPRRNWPWPDGE